VVFIYGVIRKQWALMKLPVENEIRHFRWVLFLLSVAILIGNIIPIFVDTLTILFNNPTGRPPQVRPISVMYALSNALTALISAYLIHTLYKLAADTKDVTDRQLHKVDGIMNGNEPEDK